MKVDVRWKTRTAQGARDQEEKVKRINREKRLPNDPDLANRWIIRLGLVVLVCWLLSQVAALVVLTARGAW